MQPAGILSCCMDRHPAFAHPYYSPDYFQVEWLARSLLTSYLMFHDKLDMVVELPPQPLQVLPL